INIFMNTDKKEKIDPKLAAQIKEAREKKGLTQVQVAKQAKVTETFYAMTERGESNPAFANLERILKVLGLKIVAKKQ
ncbi:MAG: helix-turn-helix transcriptional regulator, partial [Candidatus Daviesbacteria bacterium]|nr:helix-turn-helix transcriptional regulator [Candidatus Daviesbacteria bacterium]